MLTFPRLSRDKNGIWEPLSSQSVGFRGMASGGEGNTSKEQVERAVRGMLSYCTWLSGAADRAEPVRLRGKGLGQEGVKDLERPPALVPSFWGSFSPRLPLSISVGPL